jgi:tetratricopeptide (TPR) repeat protein
MRDRTSLLRLAGAIVFALAIAAIGSGAASGGDLIKDSTGQEVDSDLDARVTEARSFRLKGPNLDLDKSIALLEEITREKADYYRAWYNLALAYLQKDPENFEPIQKAFQTAADIQAKDPNIVDGSLYNSFGWALLNEGQYAAAEENLMLGLKLADTNSEWTNSALNYNLGRLYFEQGDIPSAEKYLGTAADRYKNGMAIELKSIIDKTKRPILKKGG